MTKFLLQTVFLTIIGLSMAKVDEAGIHAKKSSSDKPKQWALIVAGSNGWYNYRHQADACHAYQILHNHGIPDENIVVMMYDDIAHNDQNPTPGVIINHPMGHDVYKGVPKDYTGKDVTPENFLKVLQGKDMGGIGSGKVIKSGPNDHVFVNFVDHGGPGLIAFPDGELTAKELNHALESMYENKQYGKLVFYMEACESGSMFKGLLPTGINIFATTAANATQSSYACFFDKKRETYLGDVYSVKWMQDSDRENLRRESLGRQFKITKKDTNTSQVKEFGDLSMARLPVAEFQGEKTAKPITYHKVPFDADANCYDVPLKILQKKLSFSTHSSQRQKRHTELQNFLKKRAYVDNVMKSIVTELLGASNEALSDQERHLKTKSFLKERKDIHNWDCHQETVHFFSEKCFNLGQNPYALTHVKVLVNMCESGTPPSVIKSVLASVCSKVIKVEGGVH